MHSLHSYSIINNVLTVGHNGTFLVRRSKNGGDDSPYALTIYYEENIFHINIRYLPNGKYALGKSKLNEVVST